MANDKRFITKNGLDANSNSIINVAEPTNSSDAATKNYVDTEVSNLVDSSPETLNTLNELAAAINDDANFSTTLTNSIATKLPLAGGTMTGDINMDENSILSAGHIIPAIDSDGTTGYDLGTPTMKWRDLYLSSGSLYIDGQKVVESDSGTIIVSADPDQSLTTKVSGTGVLTLQSATTISIAGTLQIGTGKKITDQSGNAVVFGDKIDADNNQIINLGAPTENGHAVTKSYVDTAISAIATESIQEGDSTVEISDIGTGTVGISVDGTQRLAITNSSAAFTVPVTVNGNTLATEAYADTAEADAIASAAADATSKADAAEAAAVTTANAYTDTRETAITTAYQTYADTAEADAKTYADGIVSSEASTRASADTTLQNNIDTKLASSSYTAADVLAKIKTVDGAGSGLDADLLDGQSSAYYATAASVSSEASARASADSALQSAIDAENARIDAILAASDADKDTFAEIVSFINAVDTTNDTALGTEITTRAAADTTLQNNIDTKLAASHDMSLTLSGDASGSATFTNMGNATLSVTVADDSHNHVVGNIDGLAEYISDTVGGMVSSNTESGISVTYVDTDNTLDFNVNDPTITLTGAVTGSATMTNLGNVSIATTATADPTLTINGDASGSATFTNLGNATLTLTIADDSHNHTIANVDGLQTALDGKLTAGATSGNGISGSASSGTFTVTSNATSANTANTIVYRDASGNFSANVITATSTSARYADLAENYTADAEYAPGTVVSFGGDAEVTVNGVDMDRKVAGVVSTDPAHLMNADCAGNHVVALALQGRVPCKVVGAVAKGDMMVAAGNGFARAEADPKVGSIIGKALEAHEGDEGVIEVAVGRF